MSGPGQGIVPIWLLHTDDHILPSAVSVLRLQDCEMNCFLLARAVAEYDPVIINHVPQVGSFVVVNVERMVGAYFACSFFHLSAREVPG